MVECHFEVNVSIEGAHFCRIVLPSSLNREAAIQRAQTIRTRFGRPYKIDLTWIECHGESVAI
jgi:hypothetical protein